MANKLIKGYCLFGILVILVNACTNHSNELVSPAIPETSINLKFFIGGFNQSEGEVKTGFAWALSSLGAELPNGSLDRLMLTGTGSTVYEVDLSQAGFDDEALQALGTVIATLKQSQAYAMNNYIEMGRFVMLTLNSSYHYYKITGASETLMDFRSKHKFGNSKMRVINSGVSNIDRLIEIADADKVEEIAYLATEGSGSFEEGTFLAEEFEVFDFMSNGQLRFGIYDKAGNLKAAADPSITQAGKPSKCLWCHETNIQPFFTNNPVLIGADYLSKQQFMEILNVQNQYLAHYRDTLKSEVNFSNLQDHRFLEYLYIDFMEPSLERIAQEWNMDVDEAADILEGIPTHTQLEYNIKNVYHRKDIDHLAPYATIEVPESARELSKHEPNFFVF